MRSVRVLGWCVGLVVVFATAGCGSSDAGTSGGLTARSAPGGESAPARGIKGESATEKATNARLSAADCAALAKLAEHQTGTSLKRRSTPRPPLSHCRLDGRGTSINEYLDSGFAAHQRYQNRIEETVQFGYADPAKVPHPVPHVGEKVPYDAAASWIPALRSLLAARGNRWLTVTISVAGRSNRELRAMAAMLARAGFRLTAG